LKRPGFDGLTEARRQAPVFAISSAFADISKWLTRFIIDVYKSFAALIIVSALGLFSSLIMGILATSGFLVLIFTLGALFFPQLSTNQKIGSNDVKQIGRNDVKQIGSNDVKVSQGGVFSRLHNTPTFVLLMCLLSIGYLAAFEVGFRFIDYLKGNDMTGGKFISDVRSTLLIILICVLGIVPTNRPFWIRVRNWISGEKVQKILLQIGYSIPGVLIIGVFWFSGRAVPRLSDWIGVVSLAIFGLFLLVIGSRIAMAFVSDWRMFHKIKSMMFNPMRQTIAQHFEAMRTPYFRMKFVDWLERVSIAYIDVLRDPSNTWPSGKRPQLDRDPASVKLAQLDARWLDLD
jgi:hypothetical protein